MTRAREVYRTILAQCAALDKFRGTQRMQIGAWQAQIAPSVRKVLVDLGYVRVDQFAVFITLEGLSVLGYKEATA
jgi:hypothetical protein